MSNYHKLIEKCRQKYATDGVFFYGSQLFNYDTTDSDYDFIICLNQRRHFYDDELKINVKTVQMNWIERQTNRILNNDWPTSQTTVDRYQEILDSCYFGTFFCQDERLIQQINEIDYVKFSLWHLDLKWQRMKTVFTTATAHYVNHSVAWIWRQLMFLNRLTNQNYRPAILTTIQTAAKTVQWMADNKTIYHQLKKATVKWPLF